MRTAGKLTDRISVPNPLMHPGALAELSAYERGRLYEQWLTSGAYPNQEALARGLQVSAAHVSRLLKLARLPRALVNAFDSPASIRETWATDLWAAWDEPARRTLMAARARAFASEHPRPVPQYVFQQLLGAARCARRRDSRRPRDEVALDGAGTALFRIKYHTKSIAFVVPSEIASSDVVKRVKSALLVALRPEGTPTPENLP